jgi:glycosyltransferase involved in cell wall biosynthesis
MRHAALRWERFATRWTDMTLFCSRQEQSDGARHGIAGAGRVVLNGVNLAAFAPVTAIEQQAARQALGIPHGAFVAVVVGRRSPQKGQDIALRAWPSVRAECRSAVLVLMGEGYADDFDASAGVLTRAARDDARPAFAAADVVLAPSRWEGLSLSLLEGMACARPTIATEAAGSKEALTGGPLPPAGAVVATDDPFALASALLDRFRDPALVRREAAAARGRAEATFDEDATTRSVLDTYEFLLGPFLPPDPRAVPLPGFHPAYAPEDAFSHQVLER